LIASIGELVLDITITPRGPLRANDDRDASVRIGGGGQAANFCAWTASLGEPARLVTKVGDDEAGRRLVAEIEAAGVEVLAVRGKEPTGAIAVLVGRGGERSFARQRGAAAGLRRQHLQLSWFDGVRLLHVPAYSLFREPLASSARRAAELTRAGGGLISIDLSSAADLREYGGARMARELAQLAPELLFGTESEVAALDSPPGALAKVPVVKLGGRGCLVYGRRVPAPQVDEVDAPGAGDAFAAAFCVAYLDGATPLEAAGRAVLVAARAVARTGARP
jgi:sugar/nucleoside kinase (ribokinase family)